jgi:hypothetical protein
LEVQRYFKRLFRENHQPQKAMSAKPGSWRLDRLEQAVPESVWLEAEAIIDRQAVGEIVQNDDKWSTVVHSGTEDYPVSATRKGKSTLTDVYCACASFKQKGFCSHFTAFAVSLRAKIANEQSAKAQTTAFNIEMIGSEIPFSDLWTFIRQYARREKQLEWQLKARFARHIPQLADNKYSKLLDQVLPPVQDARKRQPVKRFRQALQIIDILSDEVIDALAASEYKEVFLLLEAILPKICIILRDQDPIDPKVLERYNQYIHQVRKLHHQPIAADLREQLIRWAVDLSCRSYFPNKRGFDTLYADLAVWLEGRSELWEEVLEKLLTKEKYARMQSQHVAFLALTHELFEAIDETSQYEAFLSEYKSQLEKGQQMLHFGNYHLTPEKAAGFFHAMEKVWDNTSLAPVIREALFDVVSRLPDREQKLARAEQILMEKFHPAAYDLMLGLHPEWAETFDAKIDGPMREALGTARWQQYKAAYLAYTERWGELAEFIEAQGYNMVRQYDGQLFRKVPEQMAVMYSRMLIGYLEDHHGPATARYIQDTRRHIDAIGAGAYWKGISGVVQKHFEERESVLTGLKKA